MANQEKSARMVTGRVVSDKMDKTITVLIERRGKQALYGKYLPRWTKLHAQDEKNDCQVGDLVAISESRPLSKTKTWMLQEILEKAAEA
ncbi:MAG: 30S ribosomal protein S17 [Pseudomonadales bacterium]|nr:30S ribosomal protein S17 [Pseudomonadales bacterium]